MARSNTTVRGDDGTSVTEVMVTLALLALVLAIFSSAMIAMFNRVHVADRRSQSNDAVRLAIEEIDRQVRSGNVIHDPHDPAIPADQRGMSLRIYTQTNAPTASHANRCVQWRVASGKLETRWWSRAWQSDGVISGWRTVAEHLTNAPSDTPPFSFDRDEVSYGDRVLRVRLLVNRDRNTGSDVEVAASITGRNVQFGYPITLCDSVPPE